MWHPDKPYNDLPKLPPQQELEPKAVLKRCIKAHAALARLDQACKLIPNHTILMNTLLLLEAKDSSEIENIVTTTDRLFQYIQAESQADPATKEAIRYRTALLTGLREISKGPLNINTANIVCSQIRNVDMNVRRVPGTALANEQSGEIIYTPPVGEALLRDLLENWEEYLHNRHQHDPLVQMAVLHYQFEAIHPYTDGNGRTGRALNVLFLIQRQLISSPVLYLSRYVIANKNQYYDLLLDVTCKQAWIPWILFILTAVEETARWTINKIQAMTELMESVSVLVQDKLPKIYSHELIQVIFEQPYCRIANLVETGIAKRQTASEYLKKLAEIRVLREQKAGREKLFINPGLVDLLKQPDNNFLPFQDPEKPE
jgi:Fic family protein